MKTRQTRHGRKTAGIDLRAVILAGGRGTRFWPLGREKRPKQFLPIAGKRSMVQETVERIRPLIPASRVLTVADAGQTRTLRRLLPELPRPNFVVEPLARNTAPSLMLATARVWLDNPAAVIAVLPADHLIRDAKEFLRKLEAAAVFAAKDPSLVTFGIRPTYPATGYGYIQFSKDDLRTVGRQTFYPVRAFREKPGLELAGKFLAAGNYVWNSGMFVWRADVFARKLEAFAPDLWPFWTRMVEPLRKKDGRRLAEAFEKIPAISVDYGLMEKARGVFVSEADFGWSDVGAWSSLFGIWKADQAGNVVRGECLALDSKGCLVYHPGGLTVVVGAHDLIVVEAGGALLICPADQDQRVKEVVETLRKMGKNRYL